MVKLFLISASCVLSACSTIHFTHELSNNRQPADPLRTQWHDTTIDGMIEISPPVNLYRDCQGKPWSQVTVEFSFSNGVVTGLLSSALTPIAPVFGWVTLYAPWSVETRCSQPIVESRVRAAQSTAVHAGD